MLNMTTPTDSDKPQKVGMDKVVGEDAAYNGEIDQWSYIDSHPTSSPSK